MSEARYLSKSLYIPEFLTPDLNRTLLDTLLSDKTAYQAAGLASDDPGNGTVDQTVRVAQTAQLPNDLRHQFQDAVKALLPEAAPQIGLTMPEVYKLETTAAVHEDGGFFARHIDTRRTNTLETNRYISAVYYMSRTPQRFSGGQFRLHALMGDAHQDFEAANNALVVFPSFAPHEVLPISVPSGRIEDCRFSINCWIRTPRAAA